MGNMNVDQELKEGFVMCGESGDASFFIFNTVLCFLMHIKYDPNNRVGILWEVPKFIV